MWIITDNQNRPTIIDALVSEYPDLVAYDESGFDINVDEFADAPEKLADSGYYDRTHRRILFWASERRMEKAVLQGVTAKQRSAILWALGVNGEFRPLWRTSLIRYPVMMTPNDETQEQPKAAF